MKKMGGGMILAMGSHLIDLLNYISDEKIMSLYASTDCMHDKLYDDFGNEHKVNVESFFSIKLNLSNNIKSDIVCTGTSFKDDALRMTIYGERGQINYNSNSDSYIYYIDDKNCEIISKVISNQSDKYIWKEGFEFFVLDILKNGQDCSNDKNFISFNYYKNYFEGLQSINESAEKNKIIQFNY